ncbi:hypothetical protein CG723_30255 [Streptomyces sp. CB01635]|uniref:hypothetical protein n=1 Tax=Streptomyces sp. CB01635 TaxID=2020326 RepID=UPI000C274B6A|nr:hypothetical protein CG723_30255 [Streptomyces sp. CB01635]
MGIESVRDPIPARDVVVEVGVCGLYGNDLDISQGEFAPRAANCKRAAGLVAGVVLDPQAFISDRFPLDQYETALTRLRAGQGRKTIVAPWQHLLSVRRCR